MAIIDVEGGRTSIGGGSGGRLSGSTPHKNVPATAPRPSRSREVKYSGVKRAIEGESFRVESAMFD